MASKKYKGKTCVYCAVPGISQTADHVVAESFFLPEYRDALPQVPACVDCNGKKSKLEHYAATVLPFGARHATAGRTLTEKVPARLAKNLPLTRTLGSGIKPRWTSTNGGPFELAGEIPFDAPRVLELYRYIVRGLAFDRWGLILDEKEFFVTAAYISEEGRQVLDKMIAAQTNPDQRVDGNLGDGVFVYDGTQLKSHPGLTLWRMSFYGGEVSGAAYAPNQKMSAVYGVSVHDGMPMARWFRQAMTPDKRKDGSPGL